VLSQGFSLAGAGRLDVVGCTFAHNTAHHGGAIYLAGILQVTNL